MKVIFKFKNLKHSEKVDQRLKSQSLKLKKFLKGFSEISWVCKKVDGEEFVAEARLFNSSHEYFAKGKADNLYKAFDEVIAKLEKQLLKMKEKSKSRIGHKAKKPFKRIEMEDRIKQEDLEQQDEYLGKTVA